MPAFAGMTGFGTFYECVSLNGFAKSFLIVMPDLIPAEHGIFDRHPATLWRG
jgi:hypothetical protein